MSLHALFLSICKIRKLSVKKNCKKNLFYCVLYLQAFTAIELRSVLLKFIEFQPFKCLLLLDFFCVVCEVIMLSELTELKSSKAIRLAVWNQSTFARLHTTPLPHLLYSFIKKYTRVSQHGSSDSCVLRLKSLARFENLLNSEFCFIVTDHEMIDFPSR